MSDFAIELRGIDKRFGAVHANKNISLAVPRGTIFGLVGENGAGKSTLMSILYGFYQADHGDVFISGQRQQINGPKDAIAAGIGMVFQHLKLVPNMSVLDNLMLGNEGGFVLKRGREAARNLLEELALEHGLSVDPDAIVQELPLGLQQRVEILKQLYRGAKILILDEPTDVLTPQETDELFQILKDLQSRGVTIVFITHKLNEILAATSQVAVIRRGEVVGLLNTSDTNEQQLADLMVGRSVSFKISKTKSKSGPVHLSVHNLTKQGVSRPVLNDISFELRSGEILGVAGIAGNGQTELLEVLSGISSFDRGEISLLGTQMSPLGGRAREVRAAGLSHVPEDRHKFAMVESFSATEVSALGYQDRKPFSSGAWMTWETARAETERLQEQFDVRPRNPELLSGSFSGGNQQKLILSRELSKEAEVLLVGQPTRGVDVGAIEFIHERLLEQRDAGKAILLVSVELEEVLKLSDRILVMFEGRVMGLLDAKDASEQQIGLLMAGTELEEAA
ncbi:MAG: ABC transporter ATP-binding protein [Alphaproteobacteria bacterium]